MLRRTAVTARTTKPTAASRLPGSPGATNQSGSSRSATPASTPTARRPCPVATSRVASRLDIGARLCISEGTCKTHVSSVLTKLGVRDRVQAVVVAYESGLVRPGEPATP